MDIISASKKELIDSLLKVMVTPNLRTVEHSQDDLNKYSSFVKFARIGHKASVQLPLDFAIKDDMLSLIKEYRVFIESSVKFTTTFTTQRPNLTVAPVFDARYVGNEFNYSFLDNHPGIINIDKLKDIPIDYEGLMAVPPTVLEYKNIVRFNIHRVLYTPRYSGKIIYPRVVVSNKIVAD